MPNAFPLEKTFTGHLNRDSRRQGSLHFTFTCRHLTKVSTALQEAERRHLPCRLHLNRMCVFLYVWWSAEGASYVLYCVLKTFFNASDVQKASLSPRTD